jgi:CubicO group peptidase (beta-lactamase class C family)
MNCHPKPFGLALIVFSLGLAFLASGPARAADPVDEAIAARGPQVDSYLQPLMIRSHVPGLSVAVMHRGKLLLSRAYGMANLELSVPTLPASVYQVGSITKQFTATAVMMLVEQGKINLDEKIGTYMPDLPDSWSKITLRHLLTHTSGLPDYTAPTSFWKLAQSPISQPDVIAAVAGLPLHFQPGDRWEYSNTNYFLLGMLVEKVSGKRYDQFLAERIFGPLQMTATSVNDLRKIIPNRASGYSLNGREMVNAELTHPSRAFSAGAMVSSVEDMAKWDAALSTESLLTRASLEQMWTPVKLNNGKTDGYAYGYAYGFGWLIINYHKKNTQLSHVGSIPGFTAVIRRYLDDQVTVALFVNTDSADPATLADGVHRIVTQGLPAPAP